MCSGGGAGVSVRSGGLCESPETLCGPHLGLQEQGRGADYGRGEGDFGVRVVHSGQNQTQAGFSSPLSISLAPWLLLKQGYSATELVPKNIIHIPLRGFFPRVPRNAETQARQRL